MKSQPRQFESLKIWESFKNSLPWYFAVSRNNMPAKYLIGKCIPCNLDLPSVTEAELWRENSLLTEAFLDMWEKVRTGEVSSLPRKLESPSLMDLSVELTNRML
jgi:uncharacterized Fe-S radical SAM superfamily protein PflX